MSFLARLIGAHMLGAKVRAMLNALVHVGAGARSGAPRGRRRPASKRRWTSAHTPERMLYPRG
jgi:hypothetical protein